MTCTQQQEDMIEFAALLSQWRRIMHHCSVSKPPLFRLSVQHVYLFFFFFFTCWHALNWVFILSLIWFLHSQSADITWTLNSIFNRLCKYMWYWFKIDFVGQNSTYWHFIRRQPSICIQSSTLLQLKKWQLCEGWFSCKEDGKQ